MHLKVSEEENIELKINENVEENDGLKELTRLTAEFESFMKSSKDDIVEKNESKGDLIIVETSEANSIDDNFNNVRKKSPEKVVIEVEETQSPIFEKVSPTFHYKNNVHAAPQRLEPDVEYLPSSREDTPDYIPVPVREKFYVLRIDESESNGDAIKHKSQNEVKKTSDNEKNGNVQPHHVAQETVQRIQVFEQNAQPNVQATPEPAERNYKIIKSSPKITKRTQVIQITPEAAKRSINVTQATILESDDATINPTNNFIIKTEQDEERPKPIMNGNHSSSSTTVISQTRIREETPIPIATTETVTKVETPIQFFEDIETFIRKKEHQNDEDIYDPEEPPKPPERRRSVKDIIESINRSQQLLRTSTPQFEKKYNFNCEKFSYHEKPIVPPKPNALLKFQRQAESEKKINELLADLQDFNQNNCMSAKAPKFPYDSKEDVANNNIVSQRTSTGEINPIPKPKRSLDYS